MPKLSKYSIVNCRPEAVRLALREKILHGIISPGEKLPPTDRLAELYGVSKDTISKAMELLMQEKLIVRRRGAGTFATHNLCARPSDVCRNIGMYLPMLNSDSEQLDPAISPTTFQIFSGVLSQLELEGYSLTAIPASNIDLSTRLRHFQLASVLLPRNNKYIENIMQNQIARAIPCLFMGKPDDHTVLNYLEELSDDCVCSVFQKLIQMNFRRFGVFSSSIMDYQRTAIWRGFRKAAVPGGCYNVRCEEPISEDAGQSEYDLAISELFNMPQKPEVLVIFRIRFLDGVLKALQKRHLKIPRDVSLVLVENQSSTPVVREKYKFTSALLPSKFEYGKAAGKCLLELARNPECRIQQSLVWSWHEGNTLEKNKTLTIQDGFET